MRNTADRYGDMLYTGLSMESGIAFAGSLIRLVCLMNGDDMSKLQPISVSFLNLEELLLTSPSRLELCSWMQIALQPPSSIKERSFAGHSITNSLNRPRRWH